jgi:hypothetical protein
MKSFGLLLLLAGNAVILFLLSLLAVHGNGSLDSVRLIWTTGSAWIFLAAVTALVLHRKGNNGAAFALAFLTVPGYIAGFIAAHSLVAGLDKLKPNSAEFAAACTQVGPKYIQRPAKAVTSIAFDWETNESPPAWNLYRIDDRGNIYEQRGGGVRLSSDILFTENRCCQYEGRPLNGVGPYIRRADPHFNSHRYEGVTELTADALVTYRTSTTSYRDSKARIETVDVAVTDRRDNKLLATWRYVVDHPARRACGVTSKLTIDESEFLLRAIAQK